MENTKLKKVVKKQSIKPKTYPNKLVVVQPFVLEQNPFCCIEFSHAERPRKHLFYVVFLENKILENIKIFNGEEFGNNKI